MVNINLLLMSGEKRTIAGPALDDNFLALCERAAVELGVLSCEVKLCRGTEALDFRSHYRTLHELKIEDGADLTFVRIPRPTLEVMQGAWVNSKGAKITIDGPRACFSGLVTYPIHVDAEGTVTGVGEKLHLPQGLSSWERLHFQEDTWWKVRTDDWTFGITLRTVGGVTKRAEELSPEDTLFSLRKKASQELQEELGLTRRTLILRVDERLLDESEDGKTLEQLGIVPGVSVDRKSVV